MNWFDETNVRAGKPLVVSERPYFLTVLREAGITPPKSATTSTRGWRRFMTYALKRGRSNHPRNAKWKPLHNAHLAMLVAEKLGG